MNEIKDKFMTAIKNDEVIKYLRGDWPYTVEVPQWTSTIINTDIPEILSKGIYVAYDDNKEIDILQILEFNLVKMIEKGDALDLYVALIIFLNQVRNEERNKSSFEINKEKLIGIFNEQIMLKKSILENYKVEGDSFGFDLLKEVRRISIILHEDYNLIINC